MQSFNHKEFVKNIPHKPGIYQYYDEHNLLIYIGKAKDLKNRVSSYFTNDANKLNAKTKVLVSKIRNITFTIVDTEIDAWLLENSLIKKYQPRYNVMLRDDKTYPWIVIKNENFPRVQYTRHLVKDGSKYLGPYPSLGMMYYMLNLIKETYQLRTCNLALTQANIAANKFKVCLEYQIGNCKGPCENLQTETEYQKTIEEIKDILNGKISYIIKDLKQEIDNAAKKLNFELAYSLNKKLQLLYNYQSKSTVVNSSITDIEVYSIASNDKHAFVNYLKVVNGAIIQTQTIEIKKKLDESDEELLTIAISEFRYRYQSKSKEIVVPFDLKINDNDVKFTVPKQGEKKKLLDLSQKNVLHFKKDKLEQYEKLNPDLRTHRILSQMQIDLHLKDLPTHIECFDNSNFQGDFPVSAIVVFKDAKPSKKDYRHFNVKTVDGPNDFASMEEAVYRRYKRLIEEKQSLPQLVIIDGGKGQVTSAVKSLKKLEIFEKLTVIGIAKKLEELYYPGDQYPLYLDKKSETLKIIQQLRDEAHRFGITFHRNKRDKGTLKTELENIDSIGKNTADKLLKNLKSVKKIKECSETDLLKIVTKKQAKAIISYFGKK
ncbi:MAG: excinuclease ABC subunit C [Sphingobacteriales bacterium]|nr:MAG: excinuclease ABC subunit C [Sphingobacteriales bacterium]TAF82835.1 MAG: excinuclease ABC subunit C [Sphingobacteriales bacterium]